MRARGGTSKEHEDRGPVWSHQNKLKGGVTGVRLIYTLSLRGT